MIDETRAKAYDEAAQLLVDLRDAAVQAGSKQAFDRQFASLLEKYPGKRAFHDRLRKVRLI